MIKVGYLLGAGASYPFGIPMMREFYDRFIQYVKANRAHCLPLIEKIAGDPGPDHDLEFLIQRLEQVRAIRSGLGVLAADQAALIDQVNLADEIRGYLETFLIETCERFNREKVETKLSRFVELANERGAHVFTTNYDRLIEVAAAHVSVALSDGFEQASSKPESKWDGAFNCSLKLYKLHGSVNWYEEEGSDSLVRLERGYSLPSHEYRLTHGSRALRPLMIIPTLEKAVLRRPYVGLLTHFSDALQEIDLLVVIGNSLRDDHLRNTIVERAHRLEILLVNPAAGDQTEVVARPECTHAIPLGIEEFIDLAIAPFKQMLSELDGIQDRGARRQRISTFAEHIMALAVTCAGMSQEDRGGLERLTRGDTDDLLRELGLVNTRSHSVVLARVRKLALEGEEESVRVAAIDALVEARGTDAVEVLEKISCQAGPLPVRAEAILALHSIGSALAAQALTRIGSAAGSEPSITSIVTGINGAASSH